MGWESKCLEVGGKIQGKGKKQITHVKGRGCGAKGRPNAKRDIELILLIKISKSISVLFGWLLQRTDDV